MVKLEKGMYVRTNLGIIAKLTRVFDFKYKNYYLNYCNAAVNYKSSDVVGNKGRIIKASHNIIDLIEVGDYVNGYKVIYQADCYSYFNIDTCDWIYIKENKDIKSIVTKEQFESMKYEV